MIIENPKVEDVPALRQLWKEVFADTDAFLDSFFSKAFSTKRALIVRVDGEIQAALYWFSCAWGEKTAAYVYAIATKARCRRQGLCSALMEKLHSQEKRTILVPADEGLRAFYGRMGYRDFGGLEEALYYPDGEEVKTEKLTAPDYAEKRRSLLPKGGVLQEGAFLPLLEELLVFYGGEGWLMAGREEEGEFVAAEFLGDRSLLPGILKSLRYPKARVCLPGETPFAMVRSADGESSGPSYFAFALD